MSAFKNWPKFTRDLIKCAISYLERNPQPFNIIIHRNYNLEINTQYNVIPGLVGMILTLTMVIITSIAITKEKETGTNENLLLTPAVPLEIMIGKIIVPYVLIGYVRVLLILKCVKYIFGVPILGSVWLLLFVCLFFDVYIFLFSICFSVFRHTCLGAISWESSSHDSFSSNSQRNNTERKSFS